MKIIGIDPGTATIGWGVVDETGGKCSAVAYGHIQTPKTASPEDRLLQLADELENILKTYRPEESAVEELFFSTNVKTAISVAQARGVILLTLRRFGGIIASYNPLQVKQALTGYGKADKHQMQQMVKSILHLESIPKPDDTADALAIALCHASSRKMNRLRS
jgi:crossover junction endodeoxyribonuclease RuvC